MLFKNNYNDNKSTSSGSSSNSDDEVSINGLPPIVVISDITIKKVQLDFEVLIRKKSILIFT